MSLDWQHWSLSRVGHHIREQKIITTGENEQQIDFQTEKTSDVCMHANQPAGADQGARNITTVLKKKTCIPV